MRQRNEERIAERRDPRLIEQRTPGVRSGVRGRGHVGPKFLTHRERREPGPAQFGEERRLVVIVGLRQRTEVGVVHHDLDVPGIRLVPLAAGRDEECRQQTDGQHE